MHISASVPLRHSTGFFPEPVIYIYMAGIFIPVYPHRTKRSKGCAFGKSWLYRYHFLVMRDHTLTFHLLSAELVAFKGLMYNFFFVFNNTSHNVFNVNCCHSWQSRLICVWVSPLISFSTSVLQRCRQVLTKCSSSSLMLWGAGCGEQSMGCLHWVKGL